MVYRGTNVTYGHGVAAVTETGMRSEVGRIAGMLQDVETEPTPLQHRLNRLGKILAIVALGIVGVIFVQGLLRGEDLRSMFLTAVSLAVAAVPEALPATVTIALALGSQRLLKRNALIRRLAAVETLGSVQVICADKTGTLTENEMVVAAVVDATGKRTRIDVSAANGDDRQDEVELSDHRAGALLLVGGALCTETRVEYDEGNHNGIRIVGDPTEKALVSRAALQGLPKPDLEQALPRTSGIPLDFSRKRMTTIHQCPSEDRLPEAVAASWPRDLTNSGYLAFVKGATDGLMEQSTQVWVDDHIEPLEETRREQIRKHHDDLAGSGMRLLGFAFRRLDDNPSRPEADELEKELVFVGLFGMADPPRPEVGGAIEKCRKAGIRTVMITGDHPLTRKAYCSRDRVI